MSSTNTDSWAATPRSVFDLTKPLPRDGVYIWILLNRPNRQVTGIPLNVPLRLRDASIIEQKGAVNGLPEYRFEGRYRHQYQVTIGVDFGRTHPTARIRGAAERVLHALVLPRWIPPPRHAKCGP